jgi:hypothetical protein
MSKREPPMVLNMDSLETKKRLMAKIGTLKGLYEVTLKPRKITRSLNANAYYFVAVCQPFREWLREEWQENVTTEQAHEMLKRKILGAKEIVDQKTGEVLEIPPTSRDLDVHEFAEYIEGCARWLAEFCNLVVVPSEMFWEGEERKATKTRSEQRPHMQSARV